VLCIEKRREPLRFPPFLVGETHGLLASSTSHCWVLSSTSLQFKKVSQRRSYMVVGKRCNPTFLLVMLAIVAILITYFIVVKA
jgi:hypothetical protein